MQEYKVRNKLWPRPSIIYLRDEIYGPSPPSVYVGWRNYPKVVIGPSIARESEHASLYDYPESWLGIGLGELIKMRLSMIYGLRKANIEDVWSYGILKLQEIALSNKPVDIEMNVLRKGLIRPMLTRELPPLGPRTILQSLRIAGNVSLEKPIERVYYDTDLRANEAIIELYLNKVPISRIQKALSVGALGAMRVRKLVPTRWAITAVDDIISKELVKRVKELKELNEFLLYVGYGYDNLFIAILMPGPWNFEWMEAWFPGSAWNTEGTKVSIESDWEGPKGRTTYPSIGGCYYASKLAVAEHLVNGLRREATVMLYREIYEGFNIPVGVWFVREFLRRLFKEKPRKFSSLLEVKEFLKKVTRVPVDIWWRKSYILRNYGKGRSLYEFIKKEKR